MGKQEILSAKRKYTTHNSSSHLMQQRISHLNSSTTLQMTTQNIRPIPLPIRLVLTASLDPDIERTHFGTASTFIYIFRLVETWISKQRTSNSTHAQFNT